jgi:hypothetical protein
MSALEVVARPKFGKSELEWLMRVRENRTHRSGAPDFTLVFPGADAAAVEVVRHVATTCAAIARIRFCLRSALIVPDLNGYHVFLVPDEGFGAIVRLHDRLHHGPLASCLRPDVPYIPHLTIASTDDLAVARRVKASLNAHDLAITGRIDEIEVRERDDTTPRCIARAPLAHGHLFH